MYQIIQSVVILIAYACFSVLIGPALLLPAAGRACQRVGISQRQAYDLCGSPNRKNGRAA